MMKRKKSCVIRVKGGALVFSYPDIRFKVKIDASEAVATLSKLEDTLTKHAAGAAKISK